MTDSTPSLRDRIEATLQQDQTRHELLQTLYDLAEDSEFQSLASVWAPALLVRDGRFFEGFIVRHLARWGQEDLIQAMLPYAEASGCISLFETLYRRSATNDTWNDDLLRLAASPLPDDEVMDAIRRRTANRWLRINEPAATALYERNAEQFRGFIQRHIQPQWWGKAESFSGLRKLAEQNKDDDLVWAIFRATTDAKQWTRELRRLLRARPTDDAIVGELKKRHPPALYRFDSSILMDYLEEYGAAVLPYINENLMWISQKNRQRLLRGIHRISDPGVYWSMFFRVADSPLWNEKLRRLLQSTQTPFELLIGLQMRTPDQPGGWRWSRWQLEGDVALAMYQRSPELFRPFIEEHLFDPDPALFEAVEQQGDEDFLDFLTHRALQHLNRLAWRAYPPERWLRWRKPDTAARQELAERSNMVIARFDRLYENGPSDYIRHAAHILSYFRAFDVWSYSRSLETNPAFHYLMTRHHAAWQASSYGMRELLESTNIYVQLLGLHILRDGGADAADRVLENLAALRALLLGRARINTKKTVLAALENAARQGPTYVGAILPVLEEIMEFRGKRAISERVMVSVVRLRHQPDTVTA